MNHQGQVLPYLARFAISRTETEPLQGWYSRDTAMWMLDTDSGPKPAIECKSALPETITKTDVQSEADDDIDLELVTKTRADSERDDEISPMVFS